MASNYPNWVITQDQQNNYIIARAYGLESNDIILMNESSCNVYVNTERQLIKYKNLNQNNVSKGMIVKFYLYYN